MRLWPRCGVIAGAKQKKTTIDEGKEHMFIHKNLLTYNISSKQTIEDKKLKTGQSLLAGAFDAFPHT